MNPTGFIFHSHGSYSFTNTQFIPQLYKICMMYVKLIMITLHVVVTTSVETDWLNVW